VDKSSLLKKTEDKHLTLRKSFLDESLAKKRKIEINIPLYNIDAQSLKTNKNHINMNDSNFVLNFYNNITIYNA